MLLLGHVALVCRVVVVGARGVGLSCCCCWDTWRWSVVLLFDRWSAPAPRVCDLGDLDAISLFELC